MWTAHARADSTRTRGRHRRRTHGCTPAHGCPPAHACTPAHVRARPLTHARPFTLASPLTHARPLRQTHFRRSRRLPMRSLERAHLEGRIERGPPSGWQMVVWFCRWVQPETLPAHSASCAAPRAQRLVRRASCAEPRAQRSPPHASPLPAHASSTPLTHTSPLRHRQVDFSWTARRWADYSRLMCRGRTAAERRALGALPTAIRPSALPLTLRGANHTRAPRAIAATHRRRAGGSGVRVPK